MCLLFTSARRRVKSMLEGSKCQIIVGGTPDDKDSYIPPTVVAGVKSTDPIMQDEVGLLVN